MGYVELKIIELLKQESFISVKAIHQKLHLDYKIDVSIQSVYSVVKKLVKLNIAEERSFSFNKRFVKCYRSWKK